MSERLSAIAAKLAQSLRSMPCRCSRDYDMKVTRQCQRCAAIAEYDAFTSIVQIPGAPQVPRTKV